MRQKSLNPLHLTGSGNGEDTQDRTVISLGQMIQYKVWEKGGAKSVKEYLRGYRK